MCRGEDPRAATWRQARLDHGDGACQFSGKIVKCSIVVRARAAIRNVRVCGARRDAISERARVRPKVKVEYLSLLLGLLVFTNRRCDNDVSWSRSHR